MKVQCPKVKACPALQQKQDAVFFKTKKEKRKKVVGTTPVKVEPTSVKLGKKVVGTTSVKVEPTTPVKVSSVKLGNKVVGTMPVKVEPTTPVKVSSVKFGKKVVRTTPVKVKPSSAKLENSFLKKEHDVKPKTKKRKLSGIEEKLQPQKCPTSTKKKKKLMNEPITRKTDGGPDNFTNHESKRKRKRTKKRNSKKAMEKDSEYIEWSKAYEAGEIVLKLAENSENNLFSDQELPICMEINTIKIANTPERRIRFVLPHSLATPTSEVCLFVSDLMKGKKIDHERTVQRWKEMLRLQGITEVSEVISMRQLKVEYDQFELKRSLVQRFDFFLSEGKVCGHIFHLLGKTFARRCKVPVPVDLNIFDMKNDIQRALRKTTLPVHGRGNCFGVKVGHTKHTPKEIADNIVSVCKDLARVFPGGWTNIRSLFLKVRGSPLVPLYLTLQSSNTVRVPLVAPLRPRAAVPFTDELSTIPNTAVTVYPSGTIMVNKLEGSDSDSDEEGTADDDNDDEEEGSADDEYKSFLERNKMLPENKPLQQRRDGLKRKMLDKKKPMRKSKKIDDTEDALQVEEDAYLENWQEIHTRSDDNV